MRHGVAGFDLSVDMWSARAAVPELILKGAMLWGPGLEELASHPQDRV